MASDWQALTVLSSVILRVLSYIFLRWIPGHVAPPVIFGSLVTYLFSFAKSLEATPALQVVAEETDTALVSPDGKVVAEEVGVVVADKDGRPAAEVDALLIDSNADDDDDNTQRGVGGEMAIKQTNALILGESPPHFLRSILSGLPSPSSSLLNAIIILMHIVPALMTADLVYRAPLRYQSHELSFVKVGYVSEGKANLLVREPDPQKLPLSVSIRELGPVGAGDDNIGSRWKKIDTISALTNETDFTYPVLVPGLKSSRRYAYSVSTGMNGTFETAPHPGKLQPGRGKFTFLSTSCIKPHFPYNPFSHPLSIPGFQYLSQTLDTLKPAFMLFLGDWVYVDVPRRFGSDRETYRREYRQVHASPDWPGVSGLPWIHVIDDHEIENDWDKNTTDPFPAAIDAFNLFHGSVNPPAPREPVGATWRTFTQGPVSFFLMDTRSYRKSSSLPDGPGKTMLGDLQLHALLTWLSTPEPEGVHWKVVVSSIPFTRNWRINAQDTWAGYLHERRVILERMWDVGAGPSGVGVVVLSGDRHEFAATSFPPPQNSRWPVSATVHEFSASPLSMFYLPFRTYWEANDKAVEQGQEEDICIKYVPDGNSKFGAIEIEQEVGGEQSRLHYRLFVDGREKWSYGIMSPPKGRGPRGKDAVWA